MLSAWSIPPTCEQRQQIINNDELAYSDAIIQCHGTVMFAVVQQLIWS